MDLKNEINRNDKNKNAIKLAKENINAEIVSGGGTIADTLNDVPKAIKEMIKENYKKIADINSDTTIYSDTPTKIPLNLNFKPSKVLFLLTVKLADDTGGEQTWVSTEDYKGTLDANFGTNGTVDMKGRFKAKPIITEKEMTLEVHLSYYTSGARFPRVIRCIAIE